MIGGIKPFCLLSQIKIGLKIKILKKWKTNSTIGKYNFLALYLTVTILLINPIIIR